MKKRVCKTCNNPFAGRSDKVFCSIKCKSTYHQKLNTATKNTTKKIDKILHRNRSILLEITGKNTSQKKVSKYILDQKKFTYTYCTGIHINKHYKMYHNVYNFGWMNFSGGEVLITRRNT